MKDPVKNPAGEIIRARSNRLEVTIARPQYSGADGAPQWSARFYFSKMINGQLARFPLSPIAADASKTADLIAAFLLDPTTTLADAKKKFNPRALLRPSLYSTVGELIACHEEHWKVLQLSAIAGKSYGRCLVLVLRSVDAYRRGQELESWSGRRDMDELIKPWLATSLTELNARVACDYQRLMVPPDIEDEEEDLTQKITCDSVLRSARCLFSKKAMKLYKRSDVLALPDLTEFMAVGLFNAKKFFQMQDLSVVRKIFQRAPELKRTDKNAYRAFVLCAQAGLRKTEAANFRMAWLQEEDAPVMRIRADGQFKPKHGHGRTAVLEPWVSKEIVALAAGADQFLDGNETERGEKVFDRLNAWLRKCGVDSMKPTHELRKLWFSQKVKREGLLAASQQGGHRDPKITSSFYADNKMPDNVLAFWTEPTLKALATTGLKSA